MYMKDKIGDLFNENLHTTTRTVGCDLSSLKCTALSFSAQVADFLKPKTPPPPIFSPQLGSRRPSDSGAGPDPVRGPFNDLHTKAEAEAVREDGFPP